MRIDFILLVPAILLLWMPGYLFFSSQLHKRVLDTLGSNGLRLSRIFLTWQHWVDGVRAFAGAFLLYRHTFALDKELGNAYYWEFATIAGILAVAVLIQMLYYRRNIYCLSPLFFLVGVCAAIFVWWVVLYGIIAALVFGRLINNSEAFFVILAGVVAGFGYFMHGLSPELLLVCVLAVLPVATAFALQESLIVAHR